MTVSCVEHDAVTIALSKKESAEHLEAMGGVYDVMRSKPLLVNAYALDDPNAPSEDDPNVKVVHFVRHGQGFHNLLADMYKARGIEWKQVSHVACVDERFHILKRSTSNDAFYYFFSTRIPRRIHTFFPRFSMLP